MSPAPDILAMDDAELAAHVAGLGRRLRELRQGDPRRDPVLLAYGRACAEYNARGLPDSE